MKERLPDWVSRESPLPLHPSEYGRLMQLRADVDREGQQEDRQDERNAPAPHLEISRTHRALRDQNHQQAQHQSGRPGQLNPGGQEAAPVRRTMLGDIDDGATIFAAHRKPLQQTQQKKENPGEVAGRLVGRQAAHRHGCGTHDHNGGQKGHLATEPVAQMAEQQRTNRANDEAGGERREGSEQGRGRIVRREQHGAHEGRKRPVNEEVVPFEKRSHRGSQDHLALLSSGQRSRGSFRQLYQGCVCV